MMEDDINDKYAASIRKASIEELRGVLGQIDRERFPNRYEFVRKEIEGRKDSASGLLVPQASTKKRLLILAFLLAAFGVYVVTLFITAKPSDEQIERLRVRLSSSAELKSQVGEFEVLPEMGQAGEINVSLLGKPAEGTVYFKIKTVDQEGYIAVTWKKQGDELMIIGIQNAQ